METRSSIVGIFRRYRQPLFCWTLGVMLLVGAFITAGIAKPFSLVDVVRHAMALHFEGIPMDGRTIGLLKQKFPLVSPFDKPAGVFVTLSRDGRTRACWGSVYPSHENTLQETIYATLGALTKEYRYPPITRHEVSQLKPQVTVVKRLHRMEGIAGVNPLRDGLMVRANGKSGVILPGEARDAHYQMVQARLKAGIPPHTKVQLYRIEADVYQ